MTGWRLGWLVAPPRAVPELEKLAQPAYQRAVDGAACSTGVFRAGDDRFSSSAASSSDSDGIICRRCGAALDMEPQAAFYLYCDVSAFTDDAQAFCAHFLETEHVALAPGLDFGNYRANQHVRIAYTQDVGRLQEAVERIGRGVGELEAQSRRVRCFGFGFGFGCSRGFGFCPSLGFR